MGVLHLVGRSPHESNALAQCLRRAGRGDAVLLLESGVYAVLKGSSTEPMLSDALRRVSLHALGPDLQARGIAPKEVCAGIGLVDYAGFVELTLAHGPVLSWY